MKQQEIPDASAKIQCLKITRPESHGEKFGCFVGLDHSFREEFDGADVGERVTVELVEMTKAEYDAMGEFPGW